MIDKDSCYQCPDRHTLCWSSCERYARRKARIAAAKKDHDDSRLARDFLADNIRKERRRVHKT